MAEVYRAVTTGELAQLFHQFLEMQTQQALFAMGRHPGRPNSAPPPNLKLAKLYIDHLHMLETKTSGNLSEAEATALRIAIETLTGVYEDVRTSQVRREEILEEGDQ
jgi:hypothetical protein